MTDEELSRGRRCCRCDYATKNSTGYYCARWNGPTNGPDDWCFYYKPKPEGGTTMKDETTTVTDLSAAPEAVKAQILANDQKLRDRDSGKRSRLVYICSRYRDDPDRNVQKAQEYCREALELWPDVLPLAPHVYFTQFLSDSVPRERALGLAAGISLLDICDELWVYGIQNPSEGMAAEITYAKEHGIPIIDAAELYRNRKREQLDTPIGSVTISPPASRSDLEGVSACSAAEITIEGELICELAKQLRRNPGRDLIVNGEP